MRKDRSVLRITGDLRPVLAYFFPDCINTKYFQAIHIENPMDHRFCKEAFIHQLLCLYSINLGLHIPSTTLIR